MISKDIKRLSVSVTPDFRYKLICIAEYEKRSVNKQILFLIRKCIEDYESKHGEIEIKK